MAANDSVKLSSPKSKRTCSVSGMRQTKKQRMAVAQFHEDDHEVEFQVEAPSEDFLSEGEVHSSSTDSEIEFDHEPEHSQADQVELCKQFI